MSDAFGRIPAIPDRYLHRDTSDDPNNDLEDLMSMFCASFRPLLSQAGAAAGGGPSEYEAVGMTSGAKIPWLPSQAPASSDAST
jgi:hypothetical protein